MKILSDKDAVYNYISGTDTTGTQGGASDKEGRKNDCTQNAALRDV